MEHREPPPRARSASRDLGAGEAPASASATGEGRALGRGASRSLRPVHRRAVTLAALAGLAALAVSGITRAFHAAIAWLNRQPAYRIRFRDIQLTVPPPAWYRGGAAAFLENTRRSAAEPDETLPLLNLGRDRVKLDFLRSPWVDEVVRVTYPPRGLRVELRYREPAALVQIARGPAYLLDAEARILPRDEVDPARLRHEGPLIVIAGDGLARPARLAYGETWKTSPGVHDLAPGNSRVIEAVGLAGFLRRKLQALASPRPKALEIREINPMDLENRGVFLYNAESACILWNEEPREHEPRLEPLSNDEKWAILRAWAEKTPARPLPRGDYWAFVAKELRPIHTRPAPRDQGVGLTRSR